MAKKTITNFKKESKQAYTKVIQSIKSTKTGAYTFKEQIVPLEVAQKIIYKN